MHRIVHCRAAASLLLVLAFAAAAQAEPPATAPTASTSTREERAEVLVERAKSLFRQGEYREALPLVQQAYELTASPRFLFNLGVLHHKLSECVPAREYFELYLQRDPAGAARPQTLAALEELRPRCPAQEPETTAPAPASAAAPVQRLTAYSLGPAPLELEAPPVLPLEPVEGGWAPGTGTLLMLGAGTAAGIGALVSLAAQGRAEERIDMLGQRAEREGGAWDAFEGQRRELASRARLYRGLSLGLGAACVALVGAGATVWIVESDAGSSAHPSGAGIAYLGQF